MSNDTAEEYFDLVLWRFGVAFGSCWMLVSFEDGTEWFRIGMGIYWRVK